jgi:hypothetical protein
MIAAICSMREWVCATIASIVLSGVGLYATDSDLLGILGVVEWGIDRKVAVGTPRCTPNNPWLQVKSSGR